jgi:DNA replication regulator DPB11
MKIVSWEWFEESRQRGMALDENCYNPRMSVEDRGKGAWDRRLNRSPTPLGKRTRDAEPSMVNPLRRKLRRAASSRMGTQSEALWAGITAAGLEVGKNIQDDWTEDGIAKQTTSRESAVPRNVAVAPQDDAQSAEDPAAQPFKPLPLVTNENHGIFEGRIVFAHGFDVEKVCLKYRNALDHIDVLPQTSILQQHLDSNGATVIRTSGEIDTFLDDDLSRGFLVVPHDMPTDLTALPEGTGKLCLATNWWVERCLHSKSLVNPADNVLCRPFDRQSISGTYSSELTKNVDNPC